MIATSPRLACWCGQGSWTAQFRTPRFGLLRCTACGCYGIDPPPIQRDTESAEFYTEYYAAPDGSNGVGRPAGDPLHRSRYWRVVERVPRLATAAHAALDVGCGEGKLCAELAAANWKHVIGIDVSGSRIARARQRYPSLTFHDQPIQETGIPRASLDLVVMDNVLEHLPDPIALLQEMYEFLAPGGSIVLITPNMESGNFRLLGRRWTPELAPHAHVFLYTRASIARLVSRCGFAIDASGTFHVRLRGWREWIAPIRSGAPKELLWRALQEAGDVFGRLIGAGPMLYVVATRPGRSADGAGDPPSRVSPDTRS